MMPGYGMDTARIKSEVLDVIQHNVLSILRYPYIVVNMSTIKTGRWSHLYVRVIPSILRQFYRLFTSFSSKFELKWLHWLVIILSFAMRVDPLSFYLSHINWYRSKPRFHGLSSIWWHFLSPSLLIFQKKKIIFLKFLHNVFNSYFYIKTNPLVFIKTFRFPVKLTLVISSGHYA